MLLQAARQLFAEKGYAATSVDDLVAAAGVSTATLYHHFGSKVGIFTSLADEVYRILLARFEAAVPADATFPEAVDAVLGELVDILTEDRALAHLVVTMIFATRRDPELERVLHDRLVGYQRFFDGLAARLHPSDGRAIRNLSRALVSVVNGLNVTWVMLRSERDARAATAELRRLVRSGTMGGIAE